MELSDAERQDLERLVRRHTTPQPLAVRAHSVRAAADGATTCQLARQVEVRRDLVRRWRARWFAVQPASLDDVPIVDRLTDVPRPGRPVQITAEQVGQIVALAGETPAGAERPMSHWTGRELAAAMVTRGSVPTISGRHAARLLKRGSSNRTASAPG